jgi:hypothetical protein
MELGKQKKKKRFAMKKSFINTISKIHQNMIMLEKNLFFSFAPILPPIVQPRDNYSVEA